MNNLQNYTSFQGVLDSIVKSYLLNELPPDVGQSVINNGSNRIRHTSAERDFAQEGMPIPKEILEKLQKCQSHSRKPEEGTHVNPSGKVPGTSTMGGHHSEVEVEQQYIRALYECFEKRGVFKELQTFLRHKLVSILHDEFPSLQHSFATRNEQNTIVFRLVDDFLRCHRLLYTLSVFSSESDAKQQYTRALYGKLSSKEAEGLLDDLGIKKTSRLSGQILKCYFNNEHFSLLECMHYLGVWIIDETFTEPLVKGGSKKPHVTKEGRGQSIILSKPNGFAKNGKTNCEKNYENECIRGFEEKLHDLEGEMEKEKDLKIKLFVDKFKKVEMEKLSAELETKMQLALAEKEKEQLLDLQSKMDKINEEMRQEKQRWLEVKLRQEKELCELRKQLLVAKSTKAIHDDGVESESPSQNINRDREKESECCNKCGKNVHPSSPERQSDWKLSSSSDALQQDKVAFLQYQVEQQQEEIKSLRRKVNDGSGDASAGSVPRRGRPVINNVNGNLDDLDTFLNETKGRMEKLDLAASKVDEIVQKLFSKSSRQSATSAQLQS